MDIFRQIINNWNNFWFQEVLAYNFSLFRILLSSYTILYFGQFIDRIAFFFSNQGIYASAFIPAAAVPDPWLAYLLYFFLIFALIATLIGYCSRWSSILSFCLIVYFFCINVFGKICTYEKILLIYWFLAIFMRMDCFWAIKPHNLKTSAAWTGILIGIQVMVLYFSSAYFKLMDASWHDGQVLQYIFSSMWATSLGKALVIYQAPEWIFNLMRYMVIIFESSAPILLLISELHLRIFTINIVLKNFNYWFIVLGFLFHFANMTLLKVPEFMITPIGYVFFIQPEHTAKVINNIITRLKTYISKFI